MTAIKHLSDKIQLESVSQKIFESFYTKDQEVLIEIRFGESGNQPAHRFLNLRLTFIDTPVVYDSTLQIKYTEIYTKFTNEYKLNNLQ